VEVCAVNRSQTFLVHVVAHSRNLTRYQNSCVTHLLDNGHLQAPTFHFFCEQTRKSYQAFSVLHDNIAQIINPPVILSKVLPTQGYYNQFWMVSYRLQVRVCVCVCVCVYSHAYFCVQMSGIEVQCNSVQTNVRIWLHQRVGILCVCAFFASVICTVLIVWYLTTSKNS